ncbi:MAG: beta-lactamase family protein [Ignavibacteriae bacterium]|nr:class A beta-lactamase-related serine hydrolase [Ignavibacteriota bacterium]NOG96751.1 beta-lactamase family protein [Ignavibacteriota bacterium]
MLKNPLNLLLLSSLLLNTQCSKNAEETIDELMKPYSDKNPGAAVMVIKEGEILFQKGYGLANLETGEKVTAETNFRLASISKQFTAMAILILEKKELLSVDDKIRDIFPAFPEYGKEITIKNLLRHTSGLIDYESLIPDTATIQVTDSDVLKMMNDADSLYFEPGTKFQYSNTAYAVLAMIVEKLSGNSFPEFLEENIFSKLNMKNTVAFVKGKNQIPNRSFGYNKVDDEFEFSDQSLTSAVLGDGGIYTSLEDMFKWDQALYTDVLISDRKMKEAFKRGQLNNGETIDYGFGWRRDYFEGLDRIYHPGSTCGFRNIYQRYPAQKLSVLVLTNRREPDVADIANEISKLYLN